MRSRHVHDPDFSAKRGCVWGPGLTLLLFVLITVGVLVGLYRWSHHLVPPPSPPSSPSVKQQLARLPTRTEVSWMALRLTLGALAAVVARC
jgi:hypothetical protein